MILHMLFLSLIIDKIFMLHFFIHHSDTLDYFLPKINSSLSKICCKLILPLLKFWDTLGLLSYGLVIWSHAACISFASCLLMYWKLKWGKSNINFVNFQMSLFLLSEVKFNLNKKGAGWVRMSSKLYTL